MTNPTVPWAIVETHGLADRLAGLLALQWHHNSGGFIQEVARWKALGKALPLPTISVQFGRGQERHVEVCYFTPSLDFAILGVRRFWEKKNLGGPNIRLGQWEEGAHSILHLLTILKTAPDVGPVLLLFKSTAAQALLSGLKVYRDRLLTEAIALGGQPLPLCAFWLTISAGKRIAFPEGGEATPPVLELPEQDTGQWLLNRWAGQDILDLAAACKPLADQWLNAENDAGGEAEAATPNGGAGADAKPENAPQKTAVPTNGAQIGSETAVARDATPHAVSAPGATARPATNGAAKAGANGASKRVDGATAFWTEVRTRGVDRATAQRIVADAQNDWGAALRLLQTATA